MATVSFKEFSSGKPVKPIGNESSTEFKKAHLESAKVPSEGGSIIGSVGEAAGEFVSGVKDAWKKRTDAGAEEGARAINSEISPARAALRMFGQGAGMVGDVGMEALKFAAPKPVEDLAKKGFEKVGETAPVQSMVAKYDELKTKHPEAMKDIEAAFNIASLIPIQKAGSMAVSGAVSGTKKTVGTVARGTVNAADAVVDEGKALSQTVKTVIAKKTVDPRLQESAGRIAVKTAGVVDEAPITRYNRYYDQEQAFKTDIKQDTALSLVGEKIGNAFTDVADQRRAVGKVMQEELKKVGGTQTNILPTVDNFVNELKSQGLVYDRVTKTVRQKVKQSKMSADDTMQINKYANELQELGSKPTVGDLDAFISRISNDLNVYKQKNNITGTTNGERIIKQHLTELREQFNPTKTGNPALKDYYEARQAYSQLSDFLEEGESFLGKKTQSGDYAKDASLAKSSVQSILNNGKKDWLIKLEELTGYQALDDSVLALQAMKDAGNFRGLSLLETLSDGQLPTTKAGMTQKVLDYGLGKAARLVAGTPDEQTRQFLQSLEGGAPRSAIVESVRNPAMGLSTRDVTKFLHPEDRTIMEKLIDEVRTGKRMTDAEYQQVELLARHFGIDPNKGLAEMANKFDEILQGNRDFTGTVLPGMSKNAKPKTASP